MFLLREHRNQVEDTREMQSCHAAAAVDVVFDDPNLIADAGLVPVIALAEQIGLPELVAEHVAIGDAANSAGANPAAKVMSLLAGMVAGADSIADVDRLRHAGNQVVFDEIRAPSTLGSFLRAFTHGHVQQLNAVLRQALIALAAVVEHNPGTGVISCPTASARWRSRPTRKSSPANCAAAIPINNSPAP